MGRSRIATASVLLTALALVTAACDSEPRSVASSRSTKPAASPHESATPSQRPVSADDFSTEAFGTSTVVDNEWSPMVPGTRFVYEGTAHDGPHLIKRHLVETVTDLTKPIGNVRTVVTWTRDYDDGELSEEELAFSAQDDLGNVWHVGEYPEEYDNGKIVEIPAWINGIAGATAGVAMEAQPRVGSDYAQGFAPKPVDWTDRSHTLAMGKRTCVPAGCYDGVLVVKEYEVDAPGAAQLKYYAPGVGLVRVGWMGKREKEREVLVLTHVSRLGKAELARARSAALKVERRAYRLSKDVYGQTSPSS